MSYPFPARRDRCPWQAIHKCPLYIASHDAGGLGCVDDLAQPCLVARGRWQYHAALRRLIASKLGKDIALGLAEPGGHA